MDPEGESVPFPVNKANCDTATSIPSRLCPDTDNKATDGCEPLLDATLAATYAVSPAPGREVAGVVKDESDHQLPRLFQFESTAPLK